MTDTTNNTKTLVSDEMIAEARMLRLTLTTLRMDTLDEMLNDKLTSEQQRAYGRRLCEIVSRSAALRVIIDLIETDRNNEQLYTEATWVIGDAGLYVDQMMTGTASI